MSFWPASGSDPKWSQHAAEAFRDFCEGISRLLALCHLVPSVLCSFLRLKIRRHEINDFRIRDQGKIERQVLDNASAFSETRFARGSHEQFRKSGQRRQRAAFVPNGRKITGFRPSFEPVASEESILHCVNQKEVEHVLGNDHSLVRIGSRYLQSAFFDSDVESHRDQREIIRKGRHGV